MTETQRAALEQIIRRDTSPQALVTRARIVLLAADGARNQHIADELSLHVETVSYWRTRWLEASQDLARAETDEKLLAKLLLEALADRRRSGAPMTFTAEQVCQIIALSCEPPEASSRPVTHSRAAGTGPRSCRTRPCRVDFAPQRGALFKKKP